MCRFSQLHFLLQIKTQQATSGTSAGTYKMKEPHYWSVFVYDFSVTWVGRILTDAADPVAVGASTTIGST